MIPIGSLSELGLAIREQRKEQGLTQAQLADLTGTVAETLSKIETGRYDNCGFALILRIMKSLNMELGFHPISGFDADTDDDYSDIEAAAGPGWAGMK